MTERVDFRDGARHPILRAAAHEFARRPFSVVSLDDIVARAGLTKGAMYFRFDSKRDLALAIIEDQLEVVGEYLTDRPGNRLSGLESLVESSYFLATQDITNDGLRAALNLLEQIGRSDGLQAKVFAKWSPLIASMVQRGIDDGDVITDVDPEALGRLLVGIYMGLRRVADLDDPQQFFTELEYAWTVTLPGFARAERTDYLAQFVARCTSVAKNNGSSRPPRIG